MAEAEVLLFTDGACRGNPGPGGWAYLLRHVPSGTEKRGAGGEAHTTNNRMELRAVIEGLRALKRRSAVCVVTDSEYVAVGIRAWVPGWIKNNWRRGKGAKSSPVKNVELWQDLVALCDEHEVVFQHVRGHAGHPENEDCDRRAVEAAMEFMKGRL